VFYSNPTSFESAVRLGLVHLTVTYAKRPNDRQTISISIAVCSESARAAQPTRAELLTFPFVSQGISYRERRLSHGDILEGM